MFVESAIFFTKVVNNRVVPVVDKIIALAQTMFIKYRFTRQCGAFT